VHRSRRRTFYERWIMRLTLRRPFRCHDCNWRFYGSVFSQSAWPAGREPVKPRVDEQAARDSAER
jgi:hypothetical protein